MNLSDIPMTPELIARNPELAAMVKSQVPAAKYHNAKAEASGMTFQSGHEAAGVAELILLEERHEIFALRLQVRFPLPGAGTYVADAVYLDAELQPHVVDFKGVRTPLYRRSKKQFEAKYPLKIEEV